MVQWLRELAVLTEDLGSQHPHSGSHLSITPVPGDLMPLVASDTSAPHSIPNIFGQTLTPIKRKGLRTIVSESILFRECTEGRLVKC